MRDLTKYPDEDPDIIIFDDQKVLLYGHKLLERIIETDRAIPALVFRGITIEHFIAYLQTHFPSYHCVRDLHTCDQVTSEMFKCISHAVTLTAGDAAYIVDFQRNANAREGSK